MSHWLRATREATCGTGRHEIRRVPGARFKSLCSGFPDRQPSGTDPARVSRVVSQRFPNRRGAYDCRVDLFALDDSKQKKPSRPGMNPLVAVGGIHVPSDQVRTLERGIDDLCDAAGFPDGEEFKWSPEPKSWMHKQLVHGARESFFLGVLDTARACGVTSLVVARDTKSSSAVKGAETSEVDALKMCLERANNHLDDTETHALVLVDRPSGNRKSEDLFLARCLETLRKGTGFVVPERLTLVVTTESKHVRLLQLADLVVGSTLARVAGEAQYSPRIFEAIKPMLRRDGARVGGVGLKLHPDFRYGNLYHWLLDDEWITRGWHRVELPEPGRPYHAAADAP